MNTAIIRTTTITTLALAALLPLGGCDLVGPLVLQSSDQTVEAYEILSREWLRWAMKVPYSQSPITDVTGERCAVGQGDGPWFLAATYGGPVERDCTIPADTPLFFPLSNLSAVPSNDWAEANYDYYVNVWVPKRFPAARASTCDLTLRIDGEDLLEDTAERDAELYVAITEPFSIELDDDNAWTADGDIMPGGTYDYAVIAGHWALFKPLSPGEHTLEFGGKSCDEQGEVVWETSAVYHLHVEAKHHHHGHH